MLAWVIVGVAVVEACAHALVALRVCFGGFGEFPGGFVQVPAEVADGGGAGVGPHAAADGDVFEDVDALVCESGGC